MIMRISQILYYCAVTWFQVGIDFVGPISPVSSKGNRYILTLSEYFTTRVKAVPLPTKEAIANGVAQALMKVRWLGHLCMCHVQN